ncbi:MAG: NADH-quinone oxidoreductase subunit H [Saprospiraceae bacterium]|uniref:NADH-quinone oxidoreductase subunit H n=1 Tax=Candidatus Opimibacter skivensis TaxID=2982028 RepID=A0A9D7SV01_9BACT|nr:NADH-quinone oxidoreductase subunit H [Candidatus Opimibacter skivensis]
MNILSLILILCASLFFTGIVIRTKSILSGRKGPGIFQPLKDIWRLFRKGAVYSQTSSYIFQIAPSIYFASVLIAIFLIPVGNHPGIISFRGDFIFFAYVLALGKFFMIISAMDTGSSFSGMGASREALYSLLAEPAFFILMGSFALLTGYSSFYEIFSALHFGSSISYAVGFLAAIVLVIIALIENSRMPIDDPKTHLELTMIHEVMILDNSGFDLGLILYATNLKFAMYGALIANFFLTPGYEWYYSIPIFIGVQFVFAITVGIIESFMARFRMNHNPQYIFMLTSISILIFLGVLLILGKIA